MRGQDVDDFVTVVREHDRSLRALAFRLVGPRVDDVLQEAYLRAFRSLSGFEGRSALRTWLHRIVYTTCIDELRRPQLVQLPIDGARTVRDTASLPDSRAAAATDLGVAMRELPEQQRAAVWLVDAEGFTYRETAEILDAPEGSVATWVSRARSTLRAAMGEEVQA